MAAAKASDKVYCSSKRTIQVGLQNIDTDGELHFDLERRGKESFILNVVGHLFVKSPYEKNKDKNIEVENSYIAFFKFDTLYAYSDYKPHKFIGFAQFNHFDAIHTSGQEGGMFGYLAINVTPNIKEFEAFYVFKAGDHMGGTSIFTCKAR
jgi:hypothetical protein